VGEFVTEVFRRYRGDRAAEDAVRDVPMRDLGAQDSQRHRKAGLDEASLYPYGQEDSQGRYTLDSALPPPVQD